MNRFVLCLSALMIAPLAYAQPEPGFRDVFGSSTGADDLLLIDGKDATVRPDLRQLQRGAPDASRQQVAKSFLDQLNESSQTYLERARAQARDGNTVDLDAQLGREPITVILFPGIFGEFIDTRAFEEVFEIPGTAFEREWKTAVGMHNRIPTDPSYSLALLRHIERPMEDLISCASIDRGGKAEVSVVLLRTPKLSLESAGSVDSISTMFLRRLNKFFELLGRVPQNMIFAGYSMGTTTALDTLAKAKANRAPWLSNVKGMVSLAGVNFGSTAADAALDPGGDAPAATQLKLLRQLAHDLEVPEGNWREAWNARARNVKRWAEFAAAMVPTFAGMQNGPQPDFSKLDPRKARSLLEQAIFSATSTFDVSLSREAHIKNVKRWKYFVTRVLDGVSELTTEARIDWWATHEVPEHVKYYSVAGSLVEDEPHEGGVAEGSLDFTINLGGFRDYQKAGGSALNDGQVGMHQVRFWPELSRFLNPRQGAFDAEFLGLYNTHHWGLALRTGVAGENPFPRRNLLRAIAAKASADIEARENRHGEWTQWSDQQPSSDDDDYGWEEGWGDDAPLPATTARTPAQQNGIIGGMDD